MDNTADKNSPGLLTGALQAGLVSGLLFGCIDVLRRLIDLDFSWYEIYLAFVVPVAILCAAFFICSLFIEVTAKIGKQSPKRQELLHTYSLVGLTLCDVACFDLILSLLLPGGTLLSSYHMYQSVFLVLLIALVLFLKTRDSLPELVLNFPSAVLRSSWGNNFVFVISLFTLSLLSYDLYLSFQAPAKQSSAAKADSPNVIMVVLDTVRRDALGVHGAEAKASPFLDSFAKRSLVFDNAYSVTSWTLPSHASFFTGNYPKTHGATLAAQELKEEALTLAEVLREKGYRTAGVVGNHYCQKRFGIAQGFEYYHDRMDGVAYRSKTGLIQEQFEEVVTALFGIDNEQSAEEVNASAKRWLERNGDAAFFLFLNYFDAHQPYVPSSEYAAMFTDNYELMPEINRYIKNIFSPERRYEAKSVSEEFSSTMRALYEAELRYLDDQLKSFFSWLEDKGLLENTIVVFTSDHGEEFFEHEGVDHLLTLYEEVVQVPLIFYGPGRFRAGRVSSPVSVVDIVPTIAMELGLDEFSSVDGTALQTLSPRRSRKILLERYPREKYENAGLKAVIENDWKLIEVQPERGRVVSGLYNLKKDPGEQNNLLSKEKTQRKRLEKSLQQELP